MYNTKNRLLSDLKTNYQLYIFLLPAIIFIGLFHYGPLYGIQIAFKNYSAVKGIWGSSWIGFTHFNRFWNSYYFKEVMFNTLYLSILQILFGIPPQVLFALLLNELKNKRFKKFMQTVTYMPYFISVTVMVGMMFSFFNQSSGIVNVMLGKIIGMSPIPFMQSAKWFRTMFVGSALWRTMGYGSVLYIAVLSTVDMQLHEAAIIDGAGRLKRIIHINIPYLLPTVTIMLILNFGSIISVGFEKVYLMQNNLNLSVSEVISTYAYKMGLVDSRYDFSTAISFFTSVINSFMLVSVNFIAKKIGDNSLW